MYIYVCMYPFRLWLQANTKTKEGSQKEPACDVLASRSQKPKTKNQKHRNLIRKIEAATTHTRVCCEASQKA